MSSTSNFHLRCRFDKQVPQQSELGLVMKIFRYSERPNRGLQSIASHLPPSKQKAECPDNHKQSSVFGIFLFTSLLIPTSNPLLLSFPLFPAHHVSPLQVLFYYIPTTMDNLLVRNECQMAHVICFFYAATPLFAHPWKGWPLCENPLFTQGMTPECHRNSDLVVMMSFGLENRILFSILGGNVNVQSET
ncbi:uncharacterized protein TNIN_146691 [Trichonephila inaurata madagascariensis]|uniref:Uncharacterized protein n=1 Tax=Trichonephila inaurata madagascariensis TaxID=2747483 RepID=A0A8X6Y9P4_9ARAC|nr:uncharacterized protein TNIN_146691 [Trichonephila inaurata madagascariensis]